MPLMVKGNQKPLRCVWMRNFMGVSLFFREFKLLSGEICFLKKKLKQSLNQGLQEFEFRGTSSIQIESREEKANLERLCATVFPILLVCINEVLIMSMPQNLSTLLQNLS